MVVQPHRRAVLIAQILRPFCWSARTTGRNDYHCLRDGAEPSVMVLENIGEPARAPPVAPCSVAVAARMSSRQ